MNIFMRSLTASVVLATYSTAFAEQVAVRAESYPSGKAASASGAFLMVGGDSSSAGDGDSSSAGDGDSSSAGDGDSSNGGGDSSSDGGGEGGA